MRWILRNTGRRVIVGRKQNRFFGQVLPPAGLIV
jgi:hypothetical protein